MNCRRPSRFCPSADSADLAESAEAADRGDFTTEEDMQAILDARLGRRNGQ